MVMVPSVFVAVLVIVLGTYYALVVRPENEQQRQLRKRLKTAARTNIAQLFIQRDYWGATQKYYTFGLSGIEFPYTKIAKACACIAI